MLSPLTDFPAGWPPRGQTLFWGYASMAVFLVAILLSKVIYQLVEAFMWGVALLTLIGLLWASANAESLHALPDFMRAKTRRFYLSAVSGWPVCVPIQTSPPSNTSFFQIGTVFLISSMAKRLAANAASRCADETAIITLASPI